MAQADGLNDSLDMAANVAPGVGMLFGPAGAAVGGLVGQGLRAFSQWNRSKNYKVPPRPVAVTPQGVIENQQNARQVASGALGDATNAIAQQNINQNTAQGLNAAKGSARSSTDVMATLGRLNENSNNAMNALAGNKYAQRSQGYGMLTNANNNMAGYDDRNFMYNQVEPYNQAYQEKQNLLTASNTNFDRAAQFGMQGMLGSEYLKASAGSGYTPSKGVLGNWWAKRQAHLQNVSDTGSRIGEAFQQNIDPSNLTW